MNELEQLAESLWSGMQCQLQCHCVQIWRNALTVRCLSEELEAYFWQFSKLVSKQFADFVSFPARFDDLPIDGVLIVVCATITITHRYYQLDSTIKYACLA